MEEVADLIDSMLECTRTNLDHTELRASFYLLQNHAFELMQFSGKPARITAPFKADASLLRLNKEVIKVRPHTMVLHSDARGEIINTFFSE